TEVALVVAAIHLGGVIARSIYAADTVKNPAAEKKPPASPNRWLASLEAVGKRAGRIAPLNLDISCGCTTPCRCTVEDLIAKNGFTNIPLLLGQSGRARGICKVAGDSHASQDDDNNDVLPAPHVCMTEAHISEAGSRRALKHKPPSFAWPVCRCGLF